MVKIWKVLLQILTLRTRVLLYIIVDFRSDFRLNTDTGGSFCKMLHKRFLYGLFSLSSKFTIVVKVQQTNNGIDLYYSSCDIYVCCFLSLASCDHVKCFFPLTHAGAGVSVYWWIAGVLTHTLPCSFGEVLPYALVLGRPSTDADARLHQILSCCHVSQVWTCNKCHVWNV